MELSGHCQIIMATHSPVLMAYPNARLLRLSKYGLEPVSVEQTDHFKIMREFNGQKFTIHYSAKVSGDTLKGKTEFDRDGEKQTREFEAKREKEKSEK